MRKGVPTVKRCVARQDGGFLLVLSDGRAAVSLTPVSEGCRVKVDALGRVEQEA